MNSISNQIKEVHIRTSKLRTCTCCSTNHYEDSCPECGSSSWKPISKYEYKMLLLSLTGEYSCKNLAEDKINKVLVYLDNLGYTKLVERERKKATNAKKKQISIVYSLGKKVLGPENYEKRIKAFMEQKTGKKHIWACNENELRMLIGWLRRIDNAKRKETKACDNKGVKTNGIK